MSINNKRSYTEYTVTTATTDFVIGFDDYDDGTKDTIVVTVNGILAESQGYAVMRKNAQVVTITPAVQSGTVRLERVTDIDESFHQFTAGALFSAKSVDENFEQVRHSQQEVRDGFEFLEFNTNGVISDAKVATDRANAAAELAENTDVSQLRLDLAAQKLDTGITATAKFGGVERVLDEKLADNVSLKDLGAAGDAVSDDTSAVIKAATLKSVDGNSLAYAVSNAVTDYSKFNKAAFVTPDGLTHPTEDYLDAELSRITITPTYTAWAQDKACVHNGVIYVPIMMGYGHTYTGMKLAWVKSFDGGSTWTSPEILLDVNPNSAYGWNCFSAGVINNRFVMIVEERSTVDKSLVNLYIYDRVLALSKLKSSSINLTAGSAIATITEPNNGLCVGDKVNFSSVSGTDVGGLTGTLTVTGIIDANTFQVNKGTVSDTTQTNTGGRAWYLGATFYNSPWRITPLSLFPNDLGQSITHCHSFTVRDATAGRFFFGIHNSNGRREIGFVDVSNFWKTPTTVKRRIPSTFEPSQAEPCINYLNGKTYLTTRGQSNTSNGSVFAWSADDGLTWTAARFPKNLHYSPLPFTIYDGDAYIFGTERRPNEWLSTTDTALQQGRTRSFMMKAPIAELEALDFSNLSTLTLSYGRYQGEQASSACGVGSVILYEDSLRYYFGSEDYKDSTRYSLNSPSTDNEYLADGYQPDMFEYRIDLKKPLSGINEATVRCADNSYSTFYRKGNEFLSLTPYTWVKPQKFTSTVDVLGDISFGRFLKSVNSTYLAVLPDTTNGSDTRFATLAGGGAVSGARGGMLSVYGAQHATSPNDVVVSTTTSFRPSSNGASDLGAAGSRFKSGYLQNLSLGNLAVYADNATATAGGLVVGDVYRTSTGQLMIRY